MAEQKKPDIELLFGVAGGGSVDGESGKRIKEELKSIISSINSKPMPIKVEIDDSSIKAIKQELQKVTDAAKVSVKVSKSAATSNGGNAKGRSAKNTGGSPQIEVIKAGSAEAESAITRVNKALSSLIGLWDKSSSLGKGSQSEIEGAIASLNSLKVALETDKVSYEELSQTIVKANNVASKINLTSKALGLTSGGSNILSETKEYYSALEKIYSVKARITNVKDNTVKDGTKANSVIKEQENSLIKLEEAVRNGTIGYSNLDKEITKINASLTEVVANAKDRGNYGKSVVETIKAGSVDAENAVTRVNKALSSLIGLQDKSSLLGAASQAEVEETIASLNLLKESLDTDKVTYEEFSQTIAKANNVASKINLESNLLGGNSGIQANSKEYYSALQRIYRIREQLANVKDNTVKDGASANSVIREQKKNIIELEKAVKRGAISYSDLDKEITKIKSSLTGVVTNAKARGNYGKASIKLFAGEGATTKEIQATNKALKNLSNLRKVVDDGIASTTGISKYKASYDEFKNLRQEIDALDQKLATGKMTVDTYGQEIAKLSHNVTVTKDNFGELSKSTGGSSGIIQRDIKKITTLMSSLQNMQNKYTKASGIRSKSKESYNQIGKLYNQLEVLQTQRLNRQISSSDFSAIYSNIALEAKRAEEAIKAVGEATTGVGTKVKNMFAKFSAWFSISQITMYAVRSAKQMVTNVIDIDSAMTELKKVTDETDRAYAKFLDGASTRAKKLGTTITDVVSSAADFARLGYDIDTASKYADAANVYKNVGDGIQDISEASESIISTVKAFSEYENNPMSIVDKFNEVGNNFAISSQGIGEALKRSASSLATAGNTLDESIGLITAANSVIQDPDSVGTALKTISMYLRAAKTDAEAAGEETDGMANSVSELRSEILQLTNSRVDIMVDPTTFKSTYQILKELAEVWDDLSDVDTANILELIGGKRNGNVITSLIKNFNVAESAMNTSANDSKGSALKENEKQLQSVQGKLNRLEASFQELSNTVIDSGFLKTVIDAGTIILDNLDGSIKFLEQINGIIPAIITGISAIKTITQNVGEHCKHATLYSVA